MLHVMYRSKDPAEQRGNWDCRATPINCRENTAKGVKGELDQYKAHFEKGLEQKH